MTRWKTTMMNQMDQVVRQIGMNNLSKQNLDFNNFRENNRTEMGVAVN